MHQGELFMHSLFKLLKILFMAKRPFLSDRWQLLDICLAWPEVPGLGLSSSVLLMPFGAFSSAILNFSFKYHWLAMSLTARLANFGVWNDRIFYMPNKNLASTHKGYECDLLNASISSTCGNFWLGKTIKHKGEVPAHSHSRGVTSRQFVTSRGVPEEGERWPSLLLCYAPSYGWNPVEW